MSRICNYAALYLTLLLLLPGLAIPAESSEVAHLHSFSEGLHAPIRIATDLAGNAYMTDTLKHQVCVLYASGELLRYISGIQTLLGVAVDNRGRLYVGDRETGSVHILTSEGAPIGELGGGSGQFSVPTDNMNFSLANRYEYYPASNP